MPPSPWQQHAWAPGAAGNRASHHTRTLPRPCEWTCAPGQLPPPPAPLPHTHTPESCSILSSQAAIFSMPGGTGCPRFLRSSSMAVPAEPFLSAGACGSGRSGGLRARGGCAVAMHRRVCPAGAAPPLWHASAAALASDRQGVQHACARQSVPPQQRTRLGLARPAPDLHDSARFARGAGDARLPARSPLLGSAAAAAALALVALALALAGARRGACQQTSGTRAHSTHSHNACSNQRTQKPPPQQQASQVPGRAPCPPPCP